MKSNADLLAEALHLAAVPDSLVEIPGGAYCVMTGQRIAAGHHVSDITTEATNEFLDCFRGGPDGYVSDAVARCFKASNPKEGLKIGGAHLIIDTPDGLRAFRPMISRESAKAQGRPCWSELVHTVKQDYWGMPALVILATDTKKRLWPRSRIGVIGNNTPILVYDNASSMAGVVYLDWGRLCYHLDLIESIYNLGFSKRAIAGGLTAEWKNAQFVGVPQTLRWERILKPIRSAPEFIPTLLMAQKEPEPEEQPEEQPEENQETSTCASLTEDSQL